MLSLFQMGMEKMFMQILENFEFFFEKNNYDCLKLHFCLYGVKSRSYMIIRVKNFKTRNIHIVSIHRFRLLSYNNKRKNDNDNKF